MSHVSWLKGLLGEEFAAKAESIGLCVEDYLARDAASIPPGSDGLLTIPDWLAPADQLYRKGVMIGFQELHTKAHVFRSILEGIAMTLKNHYDAMISELEVEPASIIVSGGGSASDLYMQIIADMYGVPSVRNKVSGAVALGSAICVAVAMGTYGSFREAVGQMVSKRDEFMPSMDAHAVYKRINDGVYRDLAPMMENVLRKAHEVIG
jgi:sugar (pentulose or hexulose) kinase